VIVSAEIVALIAAAVAVFAAVLSVRATALMARTVLADQHGPGHGLTVSVREGHTKRDLTTDTRDYVFIVAVRNGFSSDRRLTGVTLRVTYRTRANFLGAVDLVSDAVIDVAAGTSVDASLRFTTSNVIPRHCRIDTYTLLFLDDTGGRVTIDASLPAVLQADTDGTGPATWGWD
jgi:hypothetical protein